MAINKVALSGNLVKDPSLRTTQSGNPILSFTLAVNDRRMVNGSWEDYASYIGCSVFGKRADGLAKHLSKGTKVAVAGKLRQDRWESEGQKNSRVVVLVDDLDFMSQKQEANKEELPAESLLDTDIPF